MESGFSYIAVIYNPNSTGSSEDEARALAAALTAAEVKTEVKLIPTERAGHATDLAYQVAIQHERPLLVSSSGDGGYNEVVNGAMRARVAGARPVCAVLAAGNANDHSRTVVRRPLVDAILSGEISQIDLLKLDVRSGDGSQTTHYGHSYVGIGLTPTVAVELNRTKLNRLRETLIVYRALKNLEPVEILVDGRLLRIDSLVMATISNMAKVLTIAENVEPDDGCFVVTVFPYHRRPHLIFMLLKAMARGVRGHKTTSYEFTTVKDMVLQIDGEVHELHKGDLVRVAVAPRALATLR